MKRKDFSYERAQKEGDTFRDGRGQVWVRRPDLDFERPSGTRAVYVLDEGASAASVAEVSRSASDREAQVAADIISNAAEWLQVAGRDTRAAKGVRQAGKYAPAIEPFLPALIVERCGAVLAELGWEFRKKSDSGSRYFVRGTEVLRVSDHALPMTDEREYNWGNGHRSSTSDIVVCATTTIQEIKNAAQGLS